MTKWIPLLLILGTLQVARSAQTPTPVATRAPMTLTDWVLEVTEENVFAVSKSWNLRVPLEYDLETPVLLSVETVSENKNVVLLKYRSGLSGTTVKFAEIRAVVILRGRVVADEVWAREALESHDKLLSPRWKWDTKSLVVEDPATEEKSSYKL